VTIEELLGRRLLFTVGKGGVGRTTVTLALAFEAARRGRRTLVVELEGARGLARALEEQREVHPPAPELERITSLVVDGRRALEEYLSLIIPVRRLLKTIFSSSIYQYFVAAAPGLKELMTVGKIWYEAERREREGDGPDLVLVDAPATGHSLQYLRMPQAALEAFPVGLVHREAERVLSLLRDPAATAVVMVATAEDMPTNETIEISRGLADLGMRGSLVVVNQVHEAPATAAQIAALREALGASAATGGAARLAQAVLARAEDEASWAEINAANRKRLADEVPAPQVALPYLFGEEFGPVEVRTLARHLAESLDGGAAVPSESARETAATAATGARRGKARRAGKR
jgi:anion-transporting  ArsA/GET3 family ATPase